MAHQLTLLHEVFSDSEYMSALEKYKAVKNFEEILESRDISKLNKALYEHLHQRCYFKTHGDLKGFKNAYGGFDGCKRLLKELSLFGPYICDKYYKDINTVLVQKAREGIKDIEFKEKDDEIQLLKSLAEKYNATLRFSS